MEGSREFLQALGFISVTFPVEGQGKLILMHVHEQVPYQQGVGVRGFPMIYHGSLINIHQLLKHILICACLSWTSEEEEEFLVLPEQSPDDLELMKERRDRLQRGEPVRAQLDRQPQAFRPSPNAQRFELPPEFYNLTAEELKKEQQQRYKMSKCCTQKK